MSMVDDALEDFFPQSLPERWRKLIGHDGVAALSRVGKNLDLSPARKALITPSPDKVLRAFSAPPESVKCIIIGQDPYPGESQASGLAFSVEKQVKPLPPSLRNIHQELRDDLGIRPPSHGDLEKWSQNRVLLLNRHLTTSLGAPGDHRTLGWSSFTDSVIKGLALTELFFVSILWGREAQELRPLMGGRPTVESAHPSPISAHRGFFGSRPFSRVNQLCEDAGSLPIDWTLE